MGTIKQSINQGKITGVLSEKALSLVTSMAKDNNGKNTIPCEVIRGQITIETNNGTFSMRIYSQSKKKDGTDNAMFKGFKTILTEYISKAELAQGNIMYKVGEAMTKDKDLKDKVFTPIYNNESLVKDTTASYVITQTANKISVSIQANVNDYVGQDNTIKTSVQLNMNKANRVSNDIEDCTDLELVGVIRTIKDEVFNEEKTGRKIVDFVTIGYSADGGVANPLTLIVGEDLASDFEDMFEAGQTCKLYCEVVMRHVGGTNKSEAKFGRKANVSSGFDVLEIQVVGGEEPFENDEEEENSNVYTVAQVKELMADREIILANLLSKEKDKPKTSSNPFTDKPKGAFGKKIEVDIEDNSEDSPF